MSARNRKDGLALLVLALAVICFLLLLAAGFLVLLQHREEPPPAPPPADQRVLPAPEAPARTPEEQKALVDEVRRLAARGRAKFAVYLACPADAAAPLIADSEEMRAASMIKVFILACAMEKVMMDEAAARAGHENYTSARDLGDFFLRLYRSECVGEPYDGKMREMLFAQIDSECLPRALPQARIAHKTGELDHLYSDGGIIYGAHGRDAILVILADDIETRGRTIEMMREIACRVMGE